jgi:uncharacterized repeat protein (TIGR01451 family)
MSRAKTRACPRGILLGSILLMMLATGQAGTLIARADPPIDAPGSPSADGEEPVVPDTSSSDDVPVLPDVTVTGANDPDGPILRDSSITYTLTVTNEGDAAATAVEVTDQLPPDVTFADATAGCAESAGLVTCALGDIAAGASVEIRIIIAVREGSCGAIGNSASVSASNESGEAVGNNASDEVSNNVDCDRPTPPDIQVADAPDLRVSKGSDAGGILHEGDDFLYTITVTNAGDKVATGVELFDVLPPGALNVAVPPFPSFAGEACTVTSSVPTGGGVPHAEVRCGPISLGPGVSASVTVKVIVSGDVCGPIANVVDVEGANEPAENAGPDNRAEATDEIACVPRVLLLKEGPSLAHVGDRITYVFMVRNIGSLDLSNIDITDAACDSAPALIDDGNDDGVLSVEEKWRFRCNRTITFRDGDPVRSRARVTGDHQRGTATDSDTHDVHVIHPSIALENSANPTSGPVGTLVVYTYAVTNTGDTSLFAVSVEDTVGHVGDISTLAAGQTVELTRRMTLGSSPMTIVAAAAGSDPLGAFVSDMDDATVTAVVGAEGGGGATGGSPFTGSGADTLAGWVVVLTAVGSAMLLLSRGRSESQVRASRTYETTT